MRYARILRQADRVDGIRRYLPFGYTAEVDGDHVWIWGDDYAGWTLGDYVIPRLASGLYHADEIPAPRCYQEHCANVATDELSLVDRSLRQVGDDRPRDEPILWGWCSQHRPAAPVAVTACIQHGTWGIYCGPDCRQLTEAWDAR